MESGGGDSRVKISLWRVVDLSAASHDIDDSSGDRVEVVAFEVQVAIAEPKQQA